MATIQDEYNLAQVAPIRICLGFSYNNTTEKWEIQNAASVDLHFYNLGGQFRLTHSATINIPAQLLSAMQTAWDNRLSQYLGDGGEGEGLTIFVPADDE